MNQDYGDLEQRVAAAMATPRGRARLADALEYFSDTREMLCPLEDNPPPYMQEVIDRVKDAPVIVAQVGCSPSQAALETLATLAELTGAVHVMHDVWEVRRTPRDHRLEFVNEMQATPAKFEQCEPPKPQRPSRDDLKLSACKRRRGKR